MDGLLNRSHDLLRLIDDLLSRGASTITLGELSITFTRPPVTIEREEKPIEPLPKAPSPEELEALLYQETLKL